MNIFHLRVQYLAKYSSIAKQLASRGWHWVNGQEETGEAGDGRAEGASAIGGGGPAAISFVPDSDGMHAHIFESLQLKAHVQGTYCAWNK